MKQIMPTAFKSANTDFGQLIIAQQIRSLADVLMLKSNNLPWGRSVEINGIGSCL